ncbi:Signal recognition particle receptor FtsY [bacterium HR21]|jgi:fused signal recognition particle receptor|nr:Signal recognition particle receptor FtsY [bacterium HR21]
MSLVQRFTQALSRTRHRLLQALQDLRGVSQEAALLEALEEGLLQADVGVELTQELLQRLRERLRADGSSSLEELLRAELRALLPEVPPERFPGHPTVVLLVGVNGFGKTTTIAKLGYRWQQQGKRVLFAAADTYRAAAIEQLQQWAERLGVPCVRHHYGADPAAVAYDAVHAARARGVDVVLIDTAGRLHTKTPLMAELEKVVRVLRKVDPDAPHETLLVLDASIGHNALQQAREFQRHLPLTGVVVTKLDGTARGGMALAVARVYGVPIRYVGLGEGVHDLVPFDPEAFVAGLLGRMPAVSRE